MDRPLSERMQAEFRLGWCHYCGRPMTINAGPLQRTRDHLIPKSRGGADHESNIVFACRRCNQEKDNMTPAEYAAWRSSPNRPKRNSRHERRLVMGQFAQRVVAALSLPA